MRTWDAQLLDFEHTASVVSIARERRLVLEDNRGPRWVDLCWVDEVALALIELAIEQRQSIDLVYPAAAGELAVLLAAQLLLHQFLAPAPSPALGIVTADATMAARIWHELRIATTGAREPLAQVFPCYRAGPDGESPVGGRRFKGVDHWSALRRLASGLSRRRSPFRSCRGGGRSASSRSVL